MLLRSLPARSINSLAIQTIFYLTHYTIRHQTELNHAVGFLHLYQLNPKIIHLEINHKLKRHTWIFDSWFTSQVFKKIHSQLYFENLIHLKKVLSPFSDSHCWIFNRLPSYWTCTTKLPVLEDLDLLNTDLTSFSQNLGSCTPATLCHST